MNSNPKPSGTLFLLAMAALPASTGLIAQPAPSSTITVTADLPADPSQMTRGPDIKGVITARQGDRLRIAASDGTAPIVAITAATKIKGGGRNNSTPASLLNGLPVTIKTLQWPGGLAARQISFKSSDLKTAMMIRTGTAQQFAEQSAATQALRGRMGDIDKYNIKDTANVYFDTGKAVLSERAKADLCATSAKAEAMSNALMLVVGYTDSTGSDQINQPLSERRAGAVINYLQQQCHWKPYRMLTPTGMATADPLASNDTPEGRAQNRRVSVNILVSKSVDGM
jgi:OOP family OmpA-OmpF porin